MGHLEYHYDIVCPYAYLGSTQVEALCARVGASLSWHPLLLGGVFQAIAVDPMFTTKLNPSKAHHNRSDALRWAAHLSVDFAWHPGHPVRTVHTMRALLVTESPAELVHAFYRAYWVDHRELNREEVVAQILNETGFDGKAVIERTRHPEVKRHLRDVSTKAAGRGIFGAPAMFVGGELYWGQDRLHFVEAALRRENNLPPSDLLIA
ncbi:MAG: 2-hydroxychromene-2-carboxylate isomerase [Myxococcota bacterium]|nr:2-hydroxychromene-2-carboxylate isomerase [Myxococcota bacterium]